jgi:uracil-DNA glycosylase family 4
MNDEAARQRAARAMVETDALLGVPDVPLGRAVPGIVSDQPLDERQIENRPSVSTRSVPDAPRDLDISEGPVGRGDPAIPSSALEGDSPRSKLESLANLHAAKCEHCVTSTTHRNIVFGEGSPEATLMFIGEAPGEQEDRSGRPFVGPAGEKLDQMITALEYRREDVYITNVLKTRPPDNRTPRPDEAQACGRWLASQIAIIRPKVLVALGGPAAQLLLGTETGITRLRGSWGRYDVDGLEIPVMPTFHPAYVLRRYTTEVRAAVWSDLQLARDLARGGG